MKATTREANARTNELLKLNTYYIRRMSNRIFCGTIKAESAEQSKKDHMNYLSDEFQNILALCETKYMIQKTRRLRDYVLKETDRKVVPQNSKGDNVLHVI